MDIMKCEQERNLDGIDVYWGHVWVYEGKEMPDDYLCQCGAVRHDGCFSSKEDELNTQLTKANERVAELEEALQYIRFVSPNDIEKGTVISAIRAKAREALQVAD